MSLNLGSSDTKSSFTKGSFECSEKKKKRSEIFKTVVQKKTLYLHLPTLMLHLLDPKVFSLLAKVMSVHFSYIGTL